MMKPLVILSVLAFAPASQAAATFNAGDVFARGISGDIWNITAGGNFTATPSFAYIGASGTGDVEFSADRSTMYVSNRDVGTVYAVTPSGAVSQFATGLSLPFGLLRTLDGRLLVAEVTTGEVTDITAGGNFTAAAPFATGLTTPANLAQTADGRIFVTESQAGEISDITLGGAIGPANVFASGMSGPYALQATPSGNGLMTSDPVPATVLAISSAGTVTPFANSRSVYGLAYAPDGRLLAALLTNDRVYNISAGGNMASSPVFATVPEVVNVAVVPVPEPAGLALLAVAAGALAQRRRKA